MNGKRSRMHDAVQKTADSILAETAEHGAPNLFSPRWLEAIATRPGPHRLVSGRVGREHIDSLNAITRPQGYAVEYRDGGFIVMPHVN